MGAGLTQHHPTPEAPRDREASGGGNALISGLDITRRAPAERLPAGFIHPERSHLLSSGCPYTEEARNIRHQSRTHTPPEERLVPDSTTLQSQYAAQIQSDLDSNVAEREHIAGQISALQEQLSVLENNHALLASMQQAIGTPAVPAPGTASKKAAGASVPRIPQARSASKSAGRAAKKQAQPAAKAKASGVLPPCGSSSRRTSRRAVSRAPRPRSRRVSPTRTPAAASLAPWCATPSKTSWPRGRLSAPDRTGPCSTRLPRAATPTRPRSGRTATSRRGGRRHPRGHRLTGARCRLGGTRDATDRTGDVAAPCLTPQGCSPGGPSPARAS